MLAVEGRGGKGIVRSEKDHVVFPSLFLLSLFSFNVSSVYSSS